jgi:hypothetical protein
MRRGVFLLVPLAFAHCACGAPSGPQATSTTPVLEAAVAPSSQPDAQRPPHPVVVAIVVDQLAAWVADERLSSLPEDGGFARLLREGTYAGDVRFAHAFCATAPGHATLFSGALPRDSKITHNGWIDPQSGKYMSVLADGRVHLVGADGPTDQPGSSLSMMETETVADRLRAEHPDAFIVSLSIKDRGAVFGGGRDPDAVLWFDPRRDEAVTSTAFTSELPDWVKAANPTGIAKRLRASPWRPADPGWLTRVAPDDDGGAGEGDFLNLGTAFPHDASKATQPAKAFTATPYADEWVLELARASLDAWNGRGPFLLTLSLSGNDYVGHVFGASSKEAFDTLYRLDRGLGAFFRDLDARYGEDGYAVLLGSDHGVGPMPESTFESGLGPCQTVPPPDRERCANGHRIRRDELLPKLTQAAERALGPGSWVLGVSEPFVILTDAARALPPGDDAKLDAELLAVLRREPGVRAVYDTEELPDACPPRTDESIPALVCRSVSKGIGGDFFVVTHPGSFFDVGYTPGDGANHGTPYLYDRSVPAIVRAPGRADRGRRITTPLDAFVFARTLSELLSVTPPNDARTAPTLLRR